MKNVLKIIIFIANFVMIYIILSYFFLPKINLYKYGMYNTSLYEILGEKKNTIDTIVLGDSLVYSSVSPMEIYNEYGYTVFDCAEPAQILSDTYEYFKIAMDSQNPKVVIIEPNIFFRFFFFYSKLILAFIFLFFLYPLVILVQLFTLPVLNKIFFQLL